MNRILVVEDDPQLQLLYRSVLERAGFSVITALNGEDALKKLEATHIELIITDVMMPEMDGYDLVGSLRNARFDMPVLMITAKADFEDKKRGLNLGADDYMTKPFNPLEAIARVNSNIRRFYSLGTSPATEIIKVKDLELDVDACEFRKNGGVIELTSVEYKIMELFMKSPGKVFTKQQIYEYGWGEDFIVADNNIMVCISKLRDKLDEDSSAYIKTIRGLGYRLER